MDIHLLDPPTQVCDVNELLSPYRGIRLMAVAQAGLVAGAMRPKGVWLVGPLSPNFPQKCQTGTFRKLISNTWVRASFQIDLGTEKRKDLDVHMTSAMGQRCGLPAGAQLSPFTGTEGLSRI